MFRSLKISCSEFWSRPSSSSNFSSTHLLLHPPPTTLTCWVQFAPAYYSWVQGPPWSMVSIPEVTPLQKIMFSLSWQLPDSSSSSEGWGFLAPSSGISPSLSLWWSPARCPSHCEFTCEPALCLLTTVFLTSFSIIGSCSLPTSSSMDVSKPRGQWCRHYKWDCHCCLRVLLWGPS